MSIVGFSLELGGDVSSFTPSVQAQMQSALAAQAGVDPSAVDLTILAGSVIADVRIETYAVTAASVQSTMARATSSPSSASAMLASVTGISIVVLAVVTPPTVEEVPPPPPPSPSPPPPMSPRGTGEVAAPTVESSGSSGVIIGVSVGVTVCVIVALVLALVFMHFRKKEEKQEKKEEQEEKPTLPVQTTTDPIDPPENPEPPVKPEPSKPIVNDDIETIVEDAVQKKLAELKAENDRLQAELEAENAENDRLQEENKQRMSSRRRQNDKIADLEKQVAMTALPDYWDKEKAKSAPDGFAAIALGRTDPTFAALGRFLETDKAKLLKSGKDRSGTSHDTLKLACAWRLENPDLWYKYMSGVQKVRSNMERIQTAGMKPAGGAPVMTGSKASSLPGELRQNINEAFLMHGTGGKVVLNIISNGMNEHFAGTAAGALFGRGNYFAEDAGKCDQYTKMDMQLNAGDASDLHKRLYSQDVPHPGKVFYIFVCRVARGYHVRTQNTHGPFKSADTHQPVFPEIGYDQHGNPQWNECELNPVLGFTDILHHSLLADVLQNMRYREFIVFNSNFIYPEYLLAYQRFRGPKGPYDGISH